MRGWMMRLASGVVIAGVGMASGGASGAGGAGDAAAAEAGSAGGAEVASAASTNLDEIVRELGSEEYAAREGAQKKLDALGFKRQADVKKIAEGVSDPEVKARLAAWLDKMDDLRATHPPGITVRVKDATLAEVAAVLARETGVDIAAGAAARGRLGAAGDARYTLNMVDAPYWEVIQAITKQHAIGLGMSTQGLRLMEIGEGVVGSSGAVRRLTVNGAVGMYVRTVTRTQQSDAQAEAGKELQPPQLTMLMTVMLDPRVRVHSLEISWTSITDDLGQALAVPGQRTTISTMSSIAARSNSWSVSFPLQVPEKRGKKITEIKGEIVMMADIKDETREIDAPEKHLNEAMQVGRNQLIVRRFEEGATGILQMSLESRDSEPGAPPPPPVLGVQGARPEERIPMEIRIVDATGKVINQYRLLGGIGASMSLQNAVRPLKLIVSVPTKSKEVRVPVEMKDIVLP